MVPAKHKRMINCELFFLIFGDLLEKKVEWLFCWHNLYRKVNIFGQLFETKLCGEA